MNSKIVLTGKNKTLNDKFSQRNLKRSSKSKFEDIELGSTIGEIYRKSRSKSAVNHRKKHRDTKTIYKSMINVKPVKTKKYYTNNKPDLKENKVVKLNKTSPVVTNKLIKKDPIKPKAKELVKSPPRKLVKSPPRKLVKSPPKNVKMNKKPVVKSKNLSLQAKMCSVKKPDYKTVKVKTDINSYVIPDSIVSKSILKSNFNNKHHFTQFTDTADKYLVKVISGGIDINKYQK